eukprot:m.43958 g.43958  ORF g.43958 m.43958 type:complete len:251 (-) comp10026_c0_seq1:1148-1900(-)
MPCAWYQRMGGSNSKATTKERYEHASKTGVLALQDLKLKEVPPAVHPLSARLRVLSAQNNMLQELPSWLGTFSALKTLTLDSNFLDSLPAEFANLAKLETLSLAKNRFTGVPSCLSGMKGLKKLDFADNKLTAITPGICSLPKLDVLILSGNSIKSLPDNCGELHVSELNLNGNQIPTVPDTLSDAPKLRVLRLDENCVDRAGLPSKFLKESPVALITFDGNPLTNRQFQDLDGYDEYIARFTATKKKMN